MKLEPVMKGSTNQQREMDELLCFYANAKLRVAIHPWALQQGVPSDCDLCSIAIQLKENGSPHAHVYCERCWHAEPHPAKQGGRAVDGHPGTWAMVLYTFRTPTKNLIDQVDAAIVNDVPVMVELTPMRPSQREEGKREYAERCKTPGYTPRAYNHTGKHARPETTRDYRGRSNQ